ncbi:hypothetical protein ACJ73_09634, partial [Blastomyces percursus]
FSSGEALEENGIYIEFNRYVIEVRLLATTVWEVFEQV